MVLFIHWSCIGAKSDGAVGLQTSPVEATLEKLTRPNWAAALKVSDP